MQVKAPVPFFDTIDRVFHQLPPKNLSEIQLKSWKLCRDFLKAYSDNETTFNAYRREIERFLQYAMYIVNTSVIEFTRTHIDDYIKFCKSPPTEWVGIKFVSRFIHSSNRTTPNPKWRPFVITKKKGEKNLPKTFSMSSTALKLMFAIIGSFYEFLVSDEVINRNPVAQIRQKNKIYRHQKPGIKKLGDLEIEYLFKTLDELVLINKRYERTLFIISILYYQYLRISEVTENVRWSPRMNHFTQDQQGYWWFITVGKGNKERQITVGKEMIEALKRWREHLRLSPLPHINDDSDLIPGEKGRSLKSTRHIRMIVQKAFDETMKRLKHDNYIIEAENMAKATVHWLRHTGISNDVKKRPLEHVRDDAGHSSIMTTNNYINCHLVERARSKAGM